MSETMRLKDREIFVWDCQGKIHKSDPMSIQRRMEDKAVELGIDPNAAVADMRLATADLQQSTPDEVRGDRVAAFRAHGALAEITKAGFLVKGIEEDEESGWTEKELLALLQKFWGWCAELKKNADGSPN